MFRSTKLAEWLVPSLVAAVEGARLAFLARLPDRDLVLYLPDDSFYYLSMGRNFARSGHWTFDDVEPASGFHLAWGYLLAAVYCIHRGITLHSVLLLLGTIQVACMVGAAVLVGRTAIRLFGPGTQTGVALVFLSALSLGMGTSLMENALVLLVSAATLDLLCRSSPAGGAATLLAGFTLGFAGMLARSDFGLLPLCLFVVQIVLRTLRLSGPAMMRLAAAVLGGSVAALGAIVLHTHWISGRWVQASAAQKLFWARKLGLSAAPAIRLVERFFLPWENGAPPARHGIPLERYGSWLLPMLLLAGLVCVLSERGPMERKTAERRIWIATLAGLMLAWIGLYCFNSAEMQDWYVGNLEAPLALLAGAAAGWYARRAPLSTALTAGLICLCATALSFRAPRPWQAGLYEAGMYLRTHPELKPAGSWNAGIIAWYAEGGVVNLDGLVNDRILPHARSGTTMSYVESRRLHSIVDYSFSLVPGAGRKGRFADGTLEWCVIAPVGVPEFVDPTDPDDPVRVLLVVPDCHPAAQTDRR